MPHSQQTMFYAIRKSIRVTVKIKEALIIAKRAWNISAILIVLAVFAVAAGVAFAWLCRDSLRYDPGWQYFEEIITGNWSPDQLPQTKGGISDKSYLVGLLFAVLINYGPYVVLFAALKALVKGKKVMNLMMAMSVRDEVAKSSLTTLLSELMSADQVKKLIDTAYATAEATWPDRLGSMIGKDAVADVMKEMEENKFRRSDEN